MSHRRLAGCCASAVEDAEQYWLATTNFDCDHYSYNLSSLTTVHTTRKSGVHGTILEAHTGVAVGSKVSCWATLPCGGGHSTAATAAAEEDEYKR